MSTFDYFVARGAHWSREDGMCSMEWTAFLAGEPHSDKPACVSPLLRAFGIDFNDTLDDDLRQRLRPYLARMIGTAGDGRDDERAWLCADWVVHVYVPAWLDLAGLTVLAARLRALPEVADGRAVRRAGPLLEEARSQASAAHLAAWAVWDTAWAAGNAWDAAGSAARSSCAAAGTAARSAARVAAQNPAWAARTVAGGAAQHAAQHAALTAAWAAGGRACVTAGATAGGVGRAAEGRPTAWAALRPTVVGLQRSTFDLLDRMLPTEPLVLPAVATANPELAPVGGR